MLADLKDKVAKDCEFVIRPKIEIPPQPTQGSRTNPVPLGKEVALGDGWKLKVESVTPNATAARPRRERFQRSSERRLAVLHRPGHRHLCRAGSDRFEAAYRLRTVGAAAVSYSGFENSCGEVPDELSETELFTGGTLTGNVCWAIRSSDTASLVLYDAPVQTVPKRIFLSLH